MNIQNTGYIPVRHLPDRPMNKETIEITKEIIKTEQEAQEIRKKIISNNEKLIKAHQEQRDIMKKIIAFKPLLEHGLAMIKAGKLNDPSSAFVPKEPQVGNNSVYSNLAAKEQEFVTNVQNLGKSLVYDDLGTKFETGQHLGSVANVVKHSRDFIRLEKQDAGLTNKINKNLAIIQQNKDILANYNSSISGNPIGSREEEDAIAKILDKNVALSKQNAKYKSEKAQLLEKYQDIIQGKRNQQAILYNADMLLRNGDYKRALESYNSILLNRNDDQHNISEDYRPISEKLRQASKLYMSLQKMISRLSLTAEDRLDLYSSSIAAHTTGKFAVTKLEVLDMINKQFYYS